MRGICPAEAQAACPLMKCRGTDTHHAFYPANAYRSHIDKTWREEPFNKIQIERCVHNAIHASGYVPERPPREVMAQEIWEGGSQRAAEELQRQLTIGRSVLEGCVEGPDGQTEMDRS